MVTVEVDRPGRDGLARVDVVGCDLTGVCFAQVTSQVAPSRLGDLVAELGRKEGGIAARLIRLGLLQPPPSGPDPQR